MVVYKTKNHIVRIIQVSWFDSWPDTYRIHSPGFSTDPGFAWEFPEKWSDQTSFQSCWQVPERGSIVAITSPGKNLDWKNLKEFLPISKE